MATTVNGTSGQAHKLAVVLGFFFLSLLILNSPQVLSPLQSSSSPPSSLYHHSSVPYQLFPGFSWWFSNWSIISDLNDKTMLLNSQSQGDQTMTNSWNHCLSNFLWQQMLSVMATFFLPAFLTSIFCSENAFNTQKKKKIHTTKFYPQIASFQSASLIWPQFVILFLLFSVSFPCVTLH